MTLFLFAVGMATSLLWTTAAAQAPRDLVLVNGRIHTVNEKNEQVSALSIRDGRIMEVGSDESVLIAAEAGTRVFDLNGRTVVPGFIDAHGHLLGLGSSLLELNVTGTRSFLEVVSAVAARVEQAGPGDWIVGRGWDQNDWDGTSFPTHGMLSQIAPENPVALMRIDGHALLVNHAAMRVAGISGDTPDPEGGRIVRDDRGRPTGVLVDGAMGLVREHIPPPSPAEETRAIEVAVGECLRHGVTSVHDAGVSGDTIELYKRMVDANSLGMRIYAMIRATDVPTVNRYFDSGPLLGYGDQRLTVRCIKAMSDGALGSRGAALLEPYSDDPGNTGLLIMRKDALTKLTERALAAGFQVATHAIGDRANRVVLDAYRDALASHFGSIKTNAARLRIEHAQIVSADDIPRFAEIRVIASMQATHATSDMPWAIERLGADRLKGAYAWQRLLKSGARIANGSDFPVESVNPLWGFYAAITRQDHSGQPPEGSQPDQRMTREQALRSFTLDAAYAAFQEDDLGSIESGKRADLVVLDRDIMTVPPQDILDTRVILTFVDGRIAYRQ